MTRRLTSGGFTLAEILLILLIISIVMSSALVAFPRRQTRDAQVRGAAEELVGVLRATRSRAMERRATYAVTFNIQNTPGTSGAQLMNGSGGHWYRVVGPLTTAAALNNIPPVFDPLYCLRDMSRTQLYGYNGNKNAGYCNTLFGKPALRHWEGVMERSWVEPRHVLNPGEVRFVALTDEDNGSFMAWGSANATNPIPPYWAPGPAINMPPNQQAAYPNTYPRPWFGYWDSVAKRLYPWGGYDSAIPGSGFYYQGQGGAPAVVGSLNPVDRLVCDDSNDDSWWCAPGTNNPLQPYNPIGDNNATTYAVGKSGQPRPLINAVWQDYSLLFRPDGTVTSDWMRLRHAYNDVDPYNGCNGHTLNDFGPAERCNGAMQYSTWYPWPPWPAPAPVPPATAISFANGNAFPEASDFSSRSGFYYITLGGDLASDSTSYPTAQAALSALMPLYRVGVSQFGEVRLVQVTNSKRVPVLLDSTIVDANWYNPAITNLNYANQVLTAPGYTPLPIVDLVNTDMLTHRIMWAHP